jgi:hypothetical protein
VVVRWLALVLACVVAHGVAAPALADGGIVEVADQPVGPYRVTVTASPNPLRVGGADISVLVLQGTDTLVDNATVTIDTAPAGAATPAASYPATHANATNKQYYAANVRFPSAGRWAVTVHVRGPLGGGDVHFTADVSGAVLGLTPFEFVCTLIPGAVILAILVAEVRRRLRPKDDAGPADAR